MKDAALTHKWEDAIGKENGNWKARPCSRLCSNHFLPSDYLSPIQKCKKRPCLKASFHSGKLSVDWNGQEHFSLC